VGHHNDVNHGLIEIGDQALEGRPVQRIPGHGVVVVPIG
jgi:hypothetical protein